MKKQIEKRKWPRHPVQWPVCAKFKGPGCEPDVWYIGETCDISVDGMCILVQDCRFWPEPACRIEILCFTQPDLRMEGLPEADPVRLTGTIAWTDKTAGKMGITLTG